MPDSWAADKNIAWQIDLPGRGWSSPIVWGDRIFVTTVETDAKIPEAKKGLMIMRVSDVKRALKILNS